MFRNKAWVDKVHVLCSGEHLAATPSADPHSCASLALRPKTRNEVFLLDGLDHRLHHMVGFVAIIINKLVVPPSVRLTPMRLRIGDITNGVFMLIYGNYLGTSMRFRQKVSEDSITRQNAASG